MSEGNYFTEEEKIERLESELALCRERLGPGGIIMLLELKECRDAHQKRIEDLKERLFHETANRLAIESAFKESQSREAELREALERIDEMPNEAGGEADDACEYAQRSWVIAHEALASPKPAILAVVEAAEAFDNALSEFGWDARSISEASQLLNDAIYEWKRGAV